MGPSGPQGPAGAGTPATALPLVDATPGVVGVSGAFAREDHVHPTDTSRVAKAGDTMTGSLQITGASSNLGIGTAAPQRRFHYVGPSGPVAVLPTLGAPDLVVENNGLANISMIDGGGTLGSGLRFFTSGAAASYANIFGSDNSAAPFVRLSIGAVEKVKWTATNVNITPTTPATTPTSGALTVAGGLGVAGAVVAGGAHVCGGTANAAPALDASGQTFTVANGANVPLFSPGSGMVLICNQTTGETIAYFVGGGSSRMIGAAYGAWIDGTTTPAAGKQTVAYNGSAYAVYNNVGSTQSYVAMWFRARPFN
jgi:hypothetical protein